MLALKSVDNLPLSSVIPESALSHSNTLKIQILEVSAQLHFFLLLDSKFGKDTQLSMPVRAFHP